MQMRSTTFLLFCMSLIVLAGLHQLALYFELYWTYVWLDIPMHVLGGAVVALGFLGVSSVHERCSFRYGLSVTILVTLLLGIVWEIFEYTIGFTRIVETAIVVDTIIDTVMNICGAVLGYGVARFSRL